MPLNVKTQTGISSVLDLKVKTGSNTFADVVRLMVKKSDGTIVTVWERERSPPMPVAFGTGLADRNSIDTNETA